ncbi:hypothetical protein OF83DRAFT_660297 [Amylostereum chailletii]|nr:hypothetical protein OF83DRAFT_660297 [Amylostereum chailletii]
MTSQSEDGAGNHPHMDDVLIAATLPSRSIDLQPTDDCDGWTECLLSVHAQRQIFDHPDFPQRLVKPSKTMYALRETRTAVQAVFALDDVQTGELIMSERPLLVVPQAPIALSKDRSLVRQNQGDMKEWNKCLKAVVDRMDAQRRNAFYALANTRTKDNRAVNVLGIVATNGFDASELCEKDRPDAMGGYPVVGTDVSRLNHSCSPNATYSFQPDTFGMELRAARRIRAGEEVTISYCPIFDTHEVRRQKLALYGFDCTCAACSNPIVSDGVRCRSEFQDPLQPGVASITTSLDLLKALEHEGLQGSSQYVNYLKCASEAYHRAGDAAKAEEYRVKVFKAALGWTGRTRAFGVALF